jgi:hypothetical protein
MDIANRFYDQDLTAFNVLGVVGSQSSGSV